MSTIARESTTEVEPTAVRRGSKRHGVFGIGGWSHLRIPADRFKILKAAMRGRFAGSSLELNGFALRWEKLTRDISVPGVVAGHFQLPNPLVATKRRRIALQLFACAEFSFRIISHARHPVS
jgi:hypothetical protein